MEITNLLTEADFANETGDFARALDLLRQAREIQPENPDIANRYEYSQKIALVFDHITEIDSAIKSESPIDAIKELSRGIDILFEHLSVPNQELLRRILQLSTQNDGLLLADSLVWQDVQNLLFQLKYSDSNDWLTKNAIKFTSDYLDLARDLVLQGIISSSVQLDDFIAAFNAAKTYVTIHPGDETAIKTLADIRISLEQQSIHSARQRLDSAHHYLDQ